MFAFMVPLGIDDPKRRVALPALERFGQLLITIEDNVCLWCATRAMIEEADSAIGLRSPIEGYIFLHEDAEIYDPNVIHKLRYAFRDPEVGVIGTYGATGVRGLDWWMGEQKGRFPARNKVWGLNGYPNPSMDYTCWADPTVDCVDAYFMAISPWCAHNISLDHQHHGFHGFDADFCFAVRKAGKKVIVSDIAIEHHSPGGYGEPGGLGGYAAWEDANEIFKEKWGLSKEGAAIHDSVIHFIKDQVEQRDLSKLAVLEVGSANINGSARQFFTGAYWGIDWQEGEGVDEIMSAHDLAYFDGVFDVVVCTEMLEHDTKPWQSCSEMARVLRPFGTLLLTARGFSAKGCFPYHDPPDTYRYSALGIEVLMEHAGLLVEGIWKDPQAEGYFCCAIKP